MRKFVLFFVTVMLLSAAGAFAQDIITLKNGDDIETLIEKVGETEIEYKRWDNQTGPVYVIKKNEIFMIKYRNGSKDLFNQQPPPVTTVTPVAPVTPLTPPSTNLQSEFYGIGTDKAMLEFFRRNNFVEYYNQFNAACKTKKTAHALLGAGLGITGVGVVFHLSGKKAAKDAANATSLDEALSKAQIAGIYTDTGTSLIVIGGLSTIGSIPFYSIAASRKKAIKNDFAREYFGVTNYTYQPKLNVGTTANGIGLTLNF